MFGKKKQKETLGFETANYMMAEEYDTNKLFVANLESVTNDDMPRVETTDQRYLFELIDDKGKLKYREIFTGFVTSTWDSSTYFNLPYVENITPLKDVLPTLKDSVSKYALLLILDEVNKVSLEDEKLPCEPCVIFKDEEEEQKFSQMARDIMHKNNQLLKTMTAKVNSLNTRKEE